MYRRNTMIEAGPADGQAFRPSAGALRRTVCYGLRSDRPMSRLERLKFIVIGFLGALLVRALIRTIRWDTVGLEGEDRFWPERSPLLLVFWHNQQILMPHIYLRGCRGPACRPIGVLNSKSRDGEVAVSVLRSLGVRTVRGSSSRGGREAMFEMVRALKSGQHMGMTPDGPRGPVYRVKPGAVRIAERAGVPIYPAALVPERCWTLRSWDKLMIPKPFTRIILLMGPAITVPTPLSEEEVEAYTHRIGEEMNRLTRAGEERLGIPSRLGAESVAAC